MEYCENKTLRQLIDSGDLYSSDDKVWRLLREIAEGLEHIHSKVGCVCITKNTIWSCGLPVWYVVHAHM